MSRSKVPQYRRRPNGQAFVYHRWIKSSDHRLYLGKHGTDESLRRYRQFLKQIEVAGADFHRQLNPVQTVPRIYEVLAAYDEWARDHYKRDENELADEYDCMRYALVHLMDLFGDELIAEFGPKSLKTIQKYLVQKDYSRRHINRTISRIKRFFRWACVEELAPTDLYHRITCVRGLQRG